MRTTKAKSDLFFPPYFMLTKHRRQCFFGMLTWPVKNFVYLFFSTLNLPGVYIWVNYILYIYIYGQIIIFH